MRQPKQGLSGLLPSELHFQQSAADPALFMLRGEDMKLQGLLIVHVDDVMFCHDGSQIGCEAASKLQKRFPFGTWQDVAQQQSGSTYCGKEIRVEHKENEYIVHMSPNAFIDGRLQPIEISPSRRNDEESQASDSEKTDYRSVVGSLQWLTTQSRPDLASEVNQLQKRITDLRVGDLLRANKAVRDVMQNRFNLTFKDLGWDAELVAYHDAGLFNSVGAEMDEKEAEDLLHLGTERKLVYSQKGAILGFVKKGATESLQGGVHLNVIDWKSSTNRRIVESSCAAETHAAVMGINMAKFSQVIMSEIKYGPEIVTAVEDDGWQTLAPVTFITDCRSIYDTIHKDGRHVTEKGNIVHAVLLRQAMSTRPSDSKARLLWVANKVPSSRRLDKGRQSPRYPSPSGARPDFS